MREAFMGTRSKMMCLGIRAFDFGYGSFLRFLFFMKISHNIFTILITLWYIIQWL